MKRFMTFLDAVIGSFLLVSGTLLGSDVVVEYRMAACPAPMLLLVPFFLFFALQCRRTSASASHFQRAGLAARMAMDMFAAVVALLGIRALGASITTSVIVCFAVALCLIGIPLHVVILRRKTPQAAQDTYSGC